MGLLACLDYTRRARWARHWPLLLLGLAAFMFVRNDPEVWPVGPLGFWETLLLPEVLPHRLAVALTVGLRLFEWLVRTDRVASPGLRLVFPILHGGVSHVPLRILGVVLAWGRWLELRLPAPHTWLPGGVWRVAMIGMGVLLLFYREGP